MDAQALGRYLRETREAKEITLDEAERALRIRRRILESFEAGEFNFPDFAAIQIRGFMRNYARYLGLEEDRIVAYYEESLLESANPKRLSGRKPPPKRKDKRERQPGTPLAPRTITDTPPSLPAVVVPPPSEARRRASPLTILLRLLVAAAALAVIAYVVVQLLQTDSTPPAVPQDNIFGQLPPSPSFTPQPTNELALLPTSPPNLQPNFTGQGVLVTIKTTERTWLKITADGTDQYEGIARPGASMEYPAGDNVTVVAGNAQALDVVFDGQQQQTFGGRGQMVTVIFSKNGVQINSGPGYAPTPVTSATPLPTPTDAAGVLVAQLTPSDTPGPSPTPTPVPSDTPIPTDTPVPSATPIPSNTPIPSDTPVPTNTPIPTDTPSDTLVPTNTLTPTLTPSFTLTPTFTPTATFTWTPSYTPIPSDTPIPTNTPIPTATSILPPRVVPPGATATKVIK